jgi:hypothetical protein
MSVVEDLFKRVAASSGYNLLSAKRRIYLVYDLYECHATRTLSLYNLESYSIESFKKSIFF